MNRIAEWVVSIPRLPFRPMTSRHVGKKYPPDWVQREKWEAAEAKRARKAAKQAARKGEGSES